MTRIHIVRHGGAVYIHLPSEERYKIFATSDHRKLDAEIIEKNPKQKRLIISVKRKEGE